MLSTPPPGYSPWSMNQQNMGQGNMPASGPAPLSPLSTSSSNYAPTSSTMLPSSTMTPSSYFQPSSQMQPSNIPQNPNPDPNAHNQINMMLKALQGGIR